MLDIKPVAFDGLLTGNAPCLAPGRFTSTGPKTKSLPVAWHSRPTST